MNRGDSTRTGKDVSKYADRVKELTEKLEAGVTDLFASERFAEYLSTMSKFHRYSFRNSLLIYMQCPTATLVAGYHDWQKKFGRHVINGARGIKIFAPCWTSRLREVEEIQPDGSTAKVRKMVEFRTYRIATVFDLSQTEGRELPTIAVDLQGDVAAYDEVMEALFDIAEVPVTFEKLPEEVHGAFIHSERRIVVREGMSQAQTVKTLIHEIAHSKLHTKRLSYESPAKDRHTREVEAESVAYVVCQHFGLDTSDYSFGYVAGWSKNRTPEELMTSLDTIRQAAAEVIDGIEQRCPSLVPPMPPKVKETAITRQRASI